MINEWRTWFRRTTDDAAIDAQIRLIPPALLELHSKHPANPSVN